MGDINKKSGQHALARSKNIQKKYEKKYYALSNKKESNLVKN
jgi:hypothetical protein